jgi:hypothetical protein
LVRRLRYPAVTILRERVVWRKNRPAPQGMRTGARIDRLTREQEDNVRAGLRVLHARCDNWATVSAVTGIALRSIKRALAGTRRPTAGWVLRVAGPLMVGTDDVLAGRFPKPGACPMCGCGPEA